MADSQHSKRAAAVTEAKRSSYLRHVRVHMELLQDSLTGKQFGVDVGQDDREEIEKLLVDVWNIAWAAQLAVADRRPAPAAPPGDSVTAAPGAQGGNVIPFRPRQAD